jgi:hypothetical protein
MAQWTMASSRHHPVPWMVLESIAEIVHRSITFQYYEPLHPGIKIEKSTLHSNITIGQVQMYFIGDQRSLLPREVMGDENKIHILKYTNFTASFYSSLFIEGLNYILILGRKCKR